MNLNSIVIGRPLLFLLALVFVSGCIPSHEKEVVVYCALDKEFSQPILNEFEKETGVKVLAKYDQESNKTVGLTEEIIQQREHQRCDVFWNNEILHTLRLKKMGLLQPVQLDTAPDFPQQFISKDEDWFGFAARARVILVNTEKLTEASDRPTSINDFIDPKWKGRCAMAKPFFGTTATHAAVLFSKMGEQAAGQFFAKLKDNASIENGNKQVAIKVSQGVYDFGLTDTDDAIIEIEQGHPVAMVFPDQGDGEEGALLIPNTICLTGGPNSDAAKQLVRYLYNHQVEEKLANGSSAQIPLSARSKIRSRIEPESINIMKVDFEAAARVWEQVKMQLAEKFPL